MLAIMFNFYFDSQNAGSSLTDWIQAIASIFAVAGILWAFFRYNADQRDIQSQLNSLGTLASEAESRRLVMAKQIMPIFSGKLYSWPGTAATEMEIVTKNKGGTAYDVYATGGFREVVPSDELSTIQTGETYKFVCQWNKGEKPEDFTSIVQMHFEDAFGNKYIQLLNITREGVKERDPVMQV